MNLCDENIDALQVKALQRWGFRIRQIGADVASKGIQDAQIVSMLHRLHRPTFFTRDRRFYRRELCHPKYCIVQLDIEQDEVATSISCFLQLRGFRTNASRMGKVICYTHLSIRFWQFKSQEEHRFTW